MIKKIYFVGIKGVGMAPLALIAKQAGFEVAGSDIAEEFITDKHLNAASIHIDTNFSESSVESFFGETHKDSCLLITTGAHGGFSNPQCVWAKGNNIRVITQGMALSEFMNGEIFGRGDLEGIAIAASHGKTTISALLATVLVSIGQEVSYAIGTGDLFPLGAPGKYGSGKYFVAEADEYASEPVFDRKPKFLYLHPKYAIFNNIDFDHPDIFDTVENVYDAFFALAKNIKEGGKLFLNGDDPLLKRLHEETDAKADIVTYGVDSSNDFVISNVVAKDTTTSFQVMKGADDMGNFEINLLGEHNARNSLAVVALLTTLGYTVEEIKAGLLKFNGSKRRLEVLGKTQNGAILIDDYGHHPLEIKASLEAIRKAFQDKSITCIFQPHTYSRTKALLSDFSKSFKDADLLILMPVFKSARDTEKDILESKEYFESHKQEKKHTLFLKSEADVVEYVGQNLDNKDSIIVTMGAGDVYRIGYKILEK